VLEQGKLKGSQVLPLLFQLVENTELELLGKEIALLKGLSAVDEIVPARDHVSLYLMIDRKSLNCAKALKTGLIEVASR
jgi:hypothetical protein